MKRRLLDLLYLPACPSCDQRVPPDHALCPPCAESLYELGPACPRCAAPRDEPPATLCPRCRRRPPPFSRIVAPYRYGGELAIALQRLKYDRRPEVARSLAPLLAPALRRAVGDGGVDLAIPIPLHWSRLGKRGFNQAALLLAHAARGLPLRIDRQSLKRRRGPPQSGLGASARRDNVRGAFTIPARRRARLRGLRVLVADDVVTTGATLTAAARALLDAGAAEVLGFCAARAEPP